MKGILNKIAKLLLLTLSTMDYKTYMFVIVSIHKYFKNHGIEYALLRREEQEKAD